MKKAKLDKTLQKLMKDRGVSTRTLSQATGVPQSSISAMCAGRNSQRPEALLSISKFFGVSIEFLLFGEDDAAPTLATILSEEVFSGYLKVKIERLIPDKKK
jgi:transcriptional regulator with XRE-family HTH domain